MKDLKFEKPTAVEEIQLDGNIARFTFKPLERGYGLTIGNALRRVLLSSMPGVAIVNVRIDGVPHEFSTIDGVTEDVLGIVLNLKKIVFKTDEIDASYQQTLHLEAAGPCVVKASDFYLPSGIEIVNPDQVIATLAADAKLNMEVLVCAGIGYVSANDNRDYSDELSTIPIDSIYTPIERVVFSVEKSRGDRDELTIEIETNGAIVAKDALALASKMLVDYFNVLVEASDNAINASFIREKSDTVAVDNYDIKIEEFDFGNRLVNALKRQGIVTVADILKHTEEKIAKFDSLGKKTMVELKQKLAARGFELPSSGRTYNKTKTEDTAVAEEAETEE